MEAERREDKADMLHLLSARLLALELNIQAVLLSKVHLSNLELSHFHA